MGSTEAIEYLESEEYLKEHRLSAYTRLFVRPMFEALPDDTAERDHSRGECHCEIGAIVALESIPWTERLETHWIKYGSVPTMNMLESNKHREWAAKNDHSNNLII